MMMAEIDAAGFIIALLLKNAGDSWWIDAGISPLIRIL
jgi:hypothetical protein